MSRTKKKNRENWKPTGEGGTVATIGAPGKTIAAESVLVNPDCEVPDCKNITSRRFCIRCQVNGTAQKYLEELNASMADNSDSLASV
jgi:thiamine monophosphate kinase